MSSTASLNGFAESRRGLTDSKSLLLTFVVFGSDSLDRRFDSATEIELIWGIPTIDLVFSINFVYVFITSDSVKLPVFLGARKE